MAIGRQGYKNEKDAIIPRLPKVCSDERAAVEFFEEMRWADTPACPRCGDTAVRKMMNKEGTERNERYLWKCAGCKKQYTVRVGTIMEDSALPLTVWAFAFWQACASKKGVSAKQIQRQTGVSYKSALFVLHRVRWAMVETGGRPLTGTVECDETYVGGKPRKGDNPEKKRGRGRGVHTPVVAAVERKTGRVRTRVIANVTADNLERMLQETTHPSATIHTDELAAYRRATRGFAGHEKVSHRAGEYAREDVHCNSAEGFFSRLKRSVFGIHHKVSKEHLHRYVTHMEFLHNNRGTTDGERVRIAIRSAEGKRLMYREPQVGFG